MNMELKRRGNPKADFMRVYCGAVRRSEWDKWDTWPQYQYDTLQEAMAAFEALPDRHGCRIAEAYTVVRYKPVKED